MSRIEATPHLSKAASHLSKVETGQFPMHIKLEEFIAATRGQGPNPRKMVARACKAASIVFDPMNLTPEPGSGARPIVGYLRGSASLDSAFGRNGIGHLNHVFHDPHWSEYGDAYGIDAVICALRKQHDPDIDFVVRWRDPDFVTKSLAQRGLKFEAQGLPNGMSRIVVDAGGVNLDFIGDMSILRGWGEGNALDARVSMYAGGLDILGTRSVVQGAHAGELYVNDIDDELRKDYRMGGVPVMSWPLRKCRTKNLLGCSRDMLSACKYGLIGEGTGSIYDLALYRTQHIADPSWWEKMHTDEGYPGEFEMRESEIWANNILSCAIDPFALATMMHVLPGLASQYGLPDISEKGVFGDVIAQMAEDIGHGAGQHFGDIDRVEISRLGKAYRERLDGGVVVDLSTSGVGMLQRAFDTSCPNNGMKIMNGLKPNVSQQNKTYLLRHV